MCEGSHCCDDIGDRGSQAPAVVNDEPDGNRNVSLFEYCGFLELPVLIDKKVLQLETGDESSARVSHFHRQQDEIRRHHDWRLGLHTGRTKLRRQGRSKTENAEEKQERSKEQRSFAQIALAGTRGEDHGEAFSRPKT